ncbi:MAG TPA: ABC transporter permease [bacterium]|nr:ABC transporter permease [bacterium]
MGRWFVNRLAWLLLTLLGVTFVTFFVLDRAPVDRAELEAMRATESGSFADAAERAAAIQRLRIRYGMVDPDTLEPAPLWRRYAAWLGNAATLRFAGPSEDHEQLWRRVGQALPVTMLLGGCSLTIALVVGLAGGLWLGRRVGSARERWASAGMLVLLGIPEFLLGSLLLLAFSVVWVQWFPTGGLRSDGAERWTFAAQLADFAWHLALPVMVMAIGPTVMVTRFVRDAVARASGAAFVANLRALGLGRRVVARRLLRHGSTPVATLAGGLLPMLVGGSIVVENMFSLDGLGHLAFEAVRRQDQAMVMVLVLLTSVVTLLALLLSDLLHRLVDPRVRLQV